LVVVPKEKKAMRQINVLTFLSMDGVMQGPGGPEEDKSGGFDHGGWSVGYFDDAVGQEMGTELGRPFDLLLGRRTYDIFASHWPRVTEPGADLGINKAAKYVVTNRPLATDWSGTARRLDDGDVVVEAIRKLKASAGPELQVHGSGTLIQTLLSADLIDELWLKIFPVTLGSGRRLFAEGTRYAGFALIETSASPSGVVIAKYRRAGEVKSGSFMLPAD
jgi:dihydrofolate reductase